MNCPRVWGCCLWPVDSSGQVVGGLLAHPPTGFLLGLADRGLDLRQVLVGHSAIAKIKLMAVAPSVRRAGVGAALLRCCREVYWQCEFELLYGQFDEERAQLPAFYCGSGFDLVPDGDGIDLWMIFGRRIILGTGPHERGFYRWRRRLL
ncbi:GNAT family N-acetyltransferase [Streptomyces sp. NPDC050844]|uniref:GNAT family N-acetyltransferase n=1 Tax=Streptomyces sp. NPDC050844 TaxID=3155790 RepID=UPI0033DF62D5